MLRSWRPVSNLSLPDALRQAVIQGLDVQGLGAQAYSRLVHGEVMDDLNNLLAMSFANVSPQEANAIAMAALPGTASRPSAHRPSMSNEQCAAMILNRVARVPICLARSRLMPSKYCSMWVSILQVKHERSYVDGPENFVGPWSSLYLWPDDQPPRERLTSELLTQQRDHLQRIRQGAIKELIEIIFASGRRSLESLEIAYVTTDRLTFSAERLIHEASDGTIRLLGSRRRLSTHRGDVYREFPGYVRRYLRSVAANQGRDPDEFIDAIREYLVRSGAMANDFVLEVGGLAT